MKGIGQIAIALLLFPHCILGQQKDSVATAIVFENGTFLDLIPSSQNWENQDLSAIFIQSETIIDWPKAITQQQVLMQKMLTTIDSIQEQQSWQYLVYQKQIEQLQTQIDELQKTLIALKKNEEGPSMANLNSFLMLDYNLPTEIPIYFDKQSSSIELAALMALNEIIELLSKEPQSALLLSGHANDFSTTAENIYCSQKRVEEVRNFLISGGIAADRIIIRFMGDQSDDGKRNFKKVNITFIQKP